MADLTVNTVIDAFMQATTKAGMKGTMNIETHGADIASAPTINLETATGDVVDVTGVGTITAVTLSEGHQRLVRFTGVLQITPGASLVLPVATPIVTAAGDYALFIGYAAGVVRVVYFPQDSGAGIAIRRAASEAAQTALLSAVVGDSGSGGTKGLVPAPAAGDAAAGKFLKADGTFDVPPGMVIATPAIYYVETTGNDGTGAVGNPALPYATAGAAYAAGVTAAVNFGLMLGVGAFTLTLAANSSAYFKQAMGCGPDLTDLTISGTPAAAETGASGYAVTLNITNLSLTLTLNGGAATGVAGEAGGAGAVQTLKGSNCNIAATGNGGDSSSGDGGAASSLRFDGVFKVISTNLTGGAPGGAGAAGSAGYLEMDNCDLRACSYSPAPAGATFGRCSYTAADITPGSAMACAAY